MRTKRFPLRSIGHCRHVGANSCSLWNHRYEQSNSLVGIYRDQSTNSSRSLTLDLTHVSVAVQVDVSCLVSTRGGVIAVHEKEAEMICALV
jgi:hypothetical protein